MENNNIIEFKNENIVFHEPLNYAETNKTSSELLQKETDTIVRIALTSLLNHNDFMLYKNSSQNEMFGFAIKLKTEDITSNQTLFDLDYLKSKLNNSNNYFYPGRENYNSFYMTTSFFECPAIHFGVNIMPEPEWNEMFLLFNKILQYSPFCCLHFHKTETYVPKATLVISTEDLYDLKTASKLFRTKFNNYEEFFYQKNECAEFLSNISNLKVINIKKDDAHRVIFENTNKGEDKIEN